MKFIPLPVKLALAWLWVAVPLGWGVCQSAIKSAPLFGIHGAASPPPAPAAQPPSPEPEPEPEPD